MVELRNVCFSYPGQPQLLKEISIRFPQGKITTILGPNGSGKSTLLKIACRLLRPFSGQVLLKNRDMCTLRPKELARQIALLSQRNYPSQIPVRDLVSYGRYPYQSCGKGLDKEDERIIGQAVCQMKLEKVQNQLLSRLSGGQQQRAYIAMAIAQDTPVIFLDEPTTCLDVHICFEIMELVRAMNEAGKTIIMVLHDLNLALEYSDHIILMDHGSVAAQGTPQQMVASGMLDEVFKIHTRVLEEEGNQYFHFERKTCRHAG